MNLDPLNLHSRITSARYNAELDVLRVFFRGGALAYPAATVAFDGGRRLVFYDDAGGVVRIDFSQASRGLAIDGLPYAEAIRSAAAEAGIHPTEPALPA
jgi:hypothetical protein